MTVRGAVMNVREDSAAQNALRTALMTATAANTPLVTNSLAISRRFRMYPIRPCCPSLVRRGSGPAPPSCSRTASSQSSTYPVTAHVRTARLHDSSWAADDRVPDPRKQPPGLFAVKHLDAGKRAEHARPRECRMARIVHQRRKALDQ